MLEANSYLTLLQGVCALEGMLRTQQVCANLHTYTFMHTLSDSVNKF